MSETSSSPGLLAPANDLIPVSVISNAAAATSDTFPLNDLNHGILGSAGTLVPEVYSYLSDWSVTTRFKISCAHD